MLGIESHQSPSPILPSNPNCSNGQGRTYSGTRRFPVGPRRRETTLRPECTCRRRLAFPALRDTVALLPEPDHDHPGRCSPAPPIFPTWSMLLISPREALLVQLSYTPKHPTMPAILFGFQRYCFFIVPIGLCSLRLACCELLRQSDPGHECLERVASIHPE